MTSASDNLATLVDDMLEDAGCGQDTELRDTLLSLGTMAALPVPAPTGELAALLAAGGAMPAAEPRPRETAAGQPGGQTRDELARRRRRHRPTALGLVLVAGMGLGVGGVAASTTTPAGSAIEQLLEDWAPWDGPAADASAAGDGAGAASPGYRAPEVPADAGSAAAPAGATDAANAVSRLLRDPADLSGRANPLHCLGLVKHDAGTGSAKCAAWTAWGSGATGAAAGSGTGAAKDAAGPDGAAPGGTPAAPGLPGLQGTGKADLPSIPPAGAAGTNGAGAQKPAGSTGNGQVPAEGGNQGGSQGNAQKGASPAK